MPNVEHSTLTSTELHEPKGADTASANEVYVADGSGSGAWKTVYVQGFEDYNDTGSSQSLTTSFTDITNDGAGAFSNTTYRLPGKSAIWDTGNDQFDWSGAGLALGDTVDIRFDISVTTTGANRVIDLSIDMAHGDAGEYQLSIDSRLFKSTGTYQMIVWYSVYMGDSTTLNNPAKLVMKSDGSGDSIAVNGWYCRTTPRNPVYN